MVRAKRVIMVGSGKGGPGKTLVALNLALKLAEHGYRVGVLDGDVKAPNVPNVLGMKDVKLDFSDDRKIEAPLHRGMRVFSSGFLFHGRDGKYGVVWDAGQVCQFLGQALYNVEWGGRMDYLIIDLDPSSGDSMIYLRREFRKLYCIVVSTTSTSSLFDCERLLDGCRTHHIPVLGVVGNMVESQCPECMKQITCRCGYTVSLGVESVIREVADRYEAEYIGGIKWNPKIIMDNDRGVPDIPDQTVIDRLYDRVEHRGMWDKIMDKVG